MKRRRLLALLAGVVILGSAGVIFAHAQGDDDRVKVPPVEPKRTALLVMDYQAAWIKTLSDPGPLLSRAAKAISTSRDHGVRVAYTRVGFTPADYDAVTANNIIFSQLVKRPGGVDDDSPGMAVDRRVAPETGDKVVRKTRVGAFAGTDLDEWLRGLSIDTLILTGISTSGVVLSTVTDAADRDYRVIVVRDAVADTVPEIQDVLTNKVFPQRAQVVTVADLPGLLRKK